MFRVDIQGMDGDSELVMWASLVAVIANAIRLGYESGPSAIRARLDPS